ncbi:SRPBCC family protein [Micromonospora sp. NPDC048935]|uniref:SRPBCC family protein n=1 Tax=Micromonospora sp. NPDC048935 TaxID=3364262 RepID=UPI00371F2CED
MRNRVFAVATAVVVAGLVGTAGAPARAEVRRDVGADHATVRCAGRTVDTAAQIRYRTETTIDAPLRTVWKLQTDVERWPSWQKPVLSSKRLDRGPLRPGSSFRWTTPVDETALNPATTLVVTSTVGQLQHQRCLRWDGPAIGAGLRIDEGVHVWTFTEVDGRVLVRTEETWRGDQVEQNVDFSTVALGAGLETWLTELKTRAERECDRARRPALT